MSVPDQFQVAVLRSYLFGFADKIIAHSARKKKKFSGEGKGRSKSLERVGKGEKAQKKLGKKRKIFCFVGWTEKKRGFFSVIK